MTPSSTSSLALDQEADRRASILAAYNREFDREAWTVAYEAWNAVLQAKGLAFTDLFRKATLFDPDQAKVPAGWRPYSRSLFSPHSDAEAFINGVQSEIVSTYVLNGAEKIKWQELPRPPLSAPTFFDLSPRSCYASNFKRATDDPELFAALAIYGMAYSNQRSHFGRRPRRWESALIRLCDAAHDYIVIRGLEADIGLYVGHHWVTSLMEAENHSALYDRRVEGTLRETAVAATLEFITSTETNPLVIFDFTDEPTGSWTLDALNEMIPLLAARKKAEAAEAKIKEEARKKEWEERSRKADEDRRQAAAERDRRVVAGHPTRQDWPTLTDDELTTLLWTMPATTLGKRIGISSVAICKACRKRNIPLPGRGFWAKVQAGKKPHPQGIVQPSEAA